MATTTANLADTFSAMGVMGSFTSRAQKACAALTAKRTGSVVPVAGAPFGAFSNACPLQAPLEIKERKENYKKRSRRRRRARNKK